MSDRCPKCDYWYTIGKGDGYKGSSCRIAELEAENQKLRRQLAHHERLITENQRLREALSEIREIYTGSEGIPNPETAAEAYVLRLVQEMYQTAVEALQQSSDTAGGGDD